MTEDRFYSLVIVLASVAWGALLLLVSRAWGFPASLGLAAGAWLVIVLLRRAVPPGRAADWLRGLMIGGGIAAVLVLLLTGVVIVTTLERPGV